MSLPLLPAACVVPLTEGPLRVLWGRRNDDAPALAGFYVGPGGLTESVDERAPAEASDDGRQSSRVCALRELFEEVGLLHAHGADSLGDDARAELRGLLCDEPERGRARFEQLGLRWRTSELVHIGHYVTPDHVHARRRFAMDFYALPMAEATPPERAVSELAVAEWIEPETALARWSAGRAPLAPPMIHLLRSLATQGALDADELRVAGGAQGELSMRWEVVPYLQMLPLRTPTLPPATHTNSYLVGSGQALVVEPATPYPEELDRCVAWIEESRRDGIEPIALFATHHHPDHVGGAQALAERLSLPLWAHALTAERLEGQLSFDRLIEDGEVLELDGPTPMELMAIHTPGHAPGHLCLRDMASGAIIAGDMVASVGTILVEPTDGDMTLYLESLERLRALEPSLLLPAHGRVIRQPEALLTRYITHRLAREAKVLAALRQHAGGAQPLDLVPLVYSDTPKVLWPLAALSTEAHLEKLVRDGVASLDDEGFSIAP